MDKLLTTTLYLQDYISEEFKEDSKQQQQKEKDPSSSQKRGLFGKIQETVAKGAQMLAMNIYGKDADVYAKSIYDMFRECYFLEKWIEELEGGNKEEQALNQRLKRIVQVIEESILQMVLGDIVQLVQKYLERMEVSLTEIQQSIMK